MTTSTFSLELLIYDFLFDPARTLQASAYETCDCTRMPLHTPKTLDTCIKIKPCWIKKASRCAADRMSHTFYKIQRSYETIICICYFIRSFVKIVLYLHFLYTKDDWLWQLKRNMNDGIIIFLTSWLRRLTSLFFLIQDNFMF